MKNLALYLALIFKTCLFSVFVLTNYTFCFSQDLNRVRKTLDTLCAPSMHGRGYLNDGDKFAANFISGKFAEKGLQKYNDSYFQPFIFNVNTFPGELKLELGKNKLTPGKEFIASPNSSSGSGRGKAYFLDTLIFSTSSAKEHFLETDLAKKILLYKSKDNLRLKESDKEIQNKILTAKAIVTIEEKLTASISTYQGPTPSFQVLQSALTEATGKISFKVAAKLEENYTSNNITGYITGNTCPDSIIMITAHYDHLGRMGSIYFPGANDNASGISMLLELADYYSRNPDSCKYTLVFTAFSAEEAGLLGSHFFVENPPFPLSKIKFLVNLDLVGTGDDGIAIVNGSLFENYFSKIDSINTRGKYFDYIKKRGAAANSDHYFFSQKKVPAFFIYTLGGTKAYHDIYDIPETLPLTRYSELYQLLLKFISVL